MSLKTLLTVTTKAKKVISEAKVKLHEDAAAATASLTDQYKKSGTVFTIKTENVNVNTLTEKIKSQAGPSSTVEVYDGTAVIKSTNPSAVQRILKMMRISATVEGDILQEPENASS